ncbi:MAG: DUF1080 domain-containing protein [Planctomycetaceae bacterium]
MRLTAVLTTAMLMATGATLSAEEGWIELFDGKTLDGWIQKNGTAKYSVEEGTIVGRTNEGSPNSFLSTIKDYGNFELLVDVKVDNGLNSGIQIRSQTTDGSNHGRVNGPQVEIESSGANGAEAGYVYGEATGRGWLTPEDRLKPRKVFKDGEWNRFRILASGPRIQTWINGEAIEDLTDEPIFETHPRGFISLQVHGIKTGTGPYQVAWKNIKLRPLDDTPRPANQLTKAEEEQGFQQLFNGQDLTGWKHGGNWVIEDGVLTRTGQGGALVCEKTEIPDDFDLRFEWKVAQGSNSGVYYRPTQMEYQILDNAVHADGKNPRTSAASLYFCMAPNYDATRPVGEWNEGRVVCKGSIIQHWLNGQKVIDFDYNDPKWAAEVEMLKQRGGDVTVRGANLSLQDHGDPVWYRSIRLRTIPEVEKITHSDVEPAQIPEATLQAEQEKLQRILEQRMKAKAKK